MADATTSTTRPVLQTILGRGSATRGRIKFIDPDGRASSVDSREPLPAWFGDLTDDEQQMVRHWLARWAANAVRTAAGGQHHD